MCQIGGDYMTQNQIAYWNLQEQQRANRAQETEKRRAAIAQENIAGESNYLKAVDLAEKERSNRAGETLTASAQEEQRRHNTETEKDTDQARAQQWVKWGTETVRDERNRLIPSVSDILKILFK